jgi:hypothetical protein
MLLADSAQEVGGKLYILGGGWSLTGPNPAPSALAIKFEVPWDMTNRKLSVTIELVTADGEAVLVPGPDENEHPLRFDAQLEVGRPPGLKPGVPIDAAMALNFGPLPLQPDMRYEWRLSIDGHHDEDWSVAFATRPLHPSQQINR